MLKIKKSTTITGHSVINGVDVCGYQAIIDNENPEMLSMSEWKNDELLYKENRTVCRADEAEFEDLVYTLQDELIAQKGTEADE